MRQLQIFPVARYARRWPLPLELGRGRAVAFEFGKLHAEFARAPEPEEEARVYYMLLVAVARKRGGKGCGRN